MITIIDTPANIDKNLLNQLIELVEKGDQVERRFIKRGIESASLIGIFVDQNEIYSSVTLKNPLNSYSGKVFKLAGVNQTTLNNFQELGYIITNPKYERRGLCQNLLTDFFKIISGEQMFATTRKPSMIHILQKFGFIKLGNTYKKDLNLFFYNGKK